MFGSDGKLMGPPPVGTNTSFRAWNFTRVYQGGPTNVAWMSDIHLDRDERPVILFTTQRDGAGLPMGAGGMDHRRGGHGFAGAVRLRPVHASGKATLLFPRNRFGRQECRLSQNRSG